jgi:hypothetical protein
MYFMPKSERLIAPEALPPHIGFLLKGLSLHVQRSILSVSGRATPSSVSCPVTSAGLSPLNLTSLALKVMRGNSATLKKSALFRCSSRGRWLPTFSL